VETFGAKGYRINNAEELLPTLRAGLDDDGVSLICRPVDYSENLRLTDRLGEVDETLGACGGLAHAGGPQSPGRGIAGQHHRRKVGTEQLAIPPRPIPPPFGRRREAVLVQLRAHVAGRRLGKGIVPQQT
jgi:hypothetical protein